jgi:hypothetical protein
VFDFPEPKKAPMLLGETNPINPVSQAAFAASPFSDKK